VNKNQNQNLSYIVISGMDLREKNGSRGQKKQFREKRILGKKMDSMKACKNHPK